MDRPRGACGAARAGSVRRCARGLPDDDKPVPARRPARTIGPGPVRSGSVRPGSVPAFTRAVPGPDRPGPGPDRAIPGRTRAVPGLDRAGPVRRAARPGPHLILAAWRRRTGIEPADDAARRPPVLKTGGATRHPDASAADPTGQAAAERSPAVASYRYRSAPGSGS